MLPSSHTNLPFKFIHCTGAEAVSKGVVWGAGKLSELISFGSESLKEYVPPATEKKEIDPKWQKTASVARDVSGKAVKVSGYLCKFSLLDLFSTHVMS